VSHGFWDYAWLLAGLLCVWIAAKSVIYIAVLGAPGVLSSLIVLAPVCFFQFYKSRKAAKKK
jgi:hypothetical protein